MTRSIIVVIVFILQLGIVKGQEITMDLGGLNHSGVYNTKPLKSFNKIKWKTNLGVNGGNLILKDNIIYIHGAKGNHGDSIRQGYYFAINSKTGGIIWKDSINRFISSPTMKDNRLYFGSDDRDSKIRSINRDNGKLLWEFPLEKHSCWPPALYKEKAFFGDHNGNWYVLNNETGQLLFKKNINAGICCVPTVVDSLVFYMDLKGAFHSFNTTNYLDTIIYQTTSGVNNPPVIVDNVAYIVNGAGNMYAIDLKSNKVNWTIKIDDSMLRSPAVSDSVLTVITSHQHIYTIDRFTGNILWKIDKTGLGYTNPSIAGDIVYVSCADNNLYAFDLKTGDELWRFNAEGALSTPLIDNGILYFSCKNYLYAIE